MEERKKEPNRHSAAQRNSQSRKNTEYLARNWTVRHSHTGLDYNNAQRLYYITYYINATYNNRVTISPAFLLRPRATSHRRRRTKVSISLVDLNNRLTIVAGKTVSTRYREFLFLRARFRRKRREWFLDWRWISRVSSERPFRGLSIVLAYINDKEIGLILCTSMKRSQRGLKHSRDEKWNSCCCYVSIDQMKNLLALKHRINR